MGIHGHDKQRLRVRRRSPEHGPSPGIPFIPGQLHVRRTTVPYRLRYQRIGILDWKNLTF